MCPSFISCGAGANLLLRQSPFHRASSTSNKGSVSHIPRETGLLLHPVFLCALPDFCTGSAEIGTPSRLATSKRRCHKYPIVLVTI